MHTPRSNADWKPDAAGAFAERFEIASTAGEIERIERILLDRLEACGYDAGAVFAVRLAFQEAANNARLHGNAGEPRKRIWIRMSVEAQCVTIDIEDEGNGFDPATVPDPTLDENLEIPAGRGLTLIRAFMSEVEVIPPGNRIRMTYEKRTA